MLQVTLIGYRFEQEVYNLRCSAVPYPSFQGSDFFFDGFNPREWSGSVMEYLREISKCWVRMHDTMWRVR